MRSFGYKCVYRETKCPETLLGACKAPAGAKEVTRQWSTNREPYLGAA